VATPIKLLQLLFNSNRIKGIQFLRQGGHRVSRE
jgi:hypothetical protein